MVAAVMPLWRKRTHTHTLSANSTFLRLKELISSLSASRKKLTNEQHLTQLAGRFPAMLSGYHLKETSKNQESFEENSANGPATDTTWIP